MAEHEHHIACSDVVELVTAYFDRALPADLTSLFEEHLNFCDGCMTYVEQMRLTKETVGRLEEAHIPAQVRAQLLEAFERWERR